MIMEAWMIGGLVGLAMSGATYLILGNVINKQNGEGRIERGQPGHMLDLIRKLDLVTLPVIGAVIGHFAFGGSQ